MDIGPGEVLIVLAVLLLVFGSSQLPKLGKSLGEAIREVRQWGRYDERAETCIPPQSGDAPSRGRIGRPAAAGMKDRGEDGDPLDHPGPGRTTTASASTATPRPRGGAARSATTSSASRAAPSSRKPHGDTITTSARSPRSSDHSTPSELAPGRPSTRRAAGGLDHVGDPMAGSEGGIRPLQHQHASGRRPLARRPRSRRRRRAATIGGRPVVSRSPRRRAQIDPSTSSSDIGIERQHISPAGRATPGASSTSRQVDGAHSAQILGDDEIGVEVLESTPVEPVQVFAGLHPLLDHGVDLRRCQSRVAAPSRHDPQRAGFRPGSRTRT